MLSLVYFLKKTREAFMILCVTIENAHLFDTNPLHGQFKLRYESIIDRQDWNVPHYHKMEYDTYDNPATKYLVWQDENGKAGGVSRLYPTDRPYMLQEVFSYLAPNKVLPSSTTVLEGSRFCVDKNLPVDVRKRVCHELILAYLEYGLDNGIEQYVGVMLPIYWRNLFIKLGWEVDFFGDAMKLENGQSVRAGGVIVSEEALSAVRSATGISTPVLSYGKTNAPILLKTGTS
jgi:acyl homoserine lactone synthase